MAAGALAAETIAESLCDDATRATTLYALETMPAPIPRELAVAAASALVDVAAGTKHGETFDRCALLVARLLAEAAPDPSVIYAAAFGGDRWMAFCASQSIMESAQRALGTGIAEKAETTGTLTREDAYSNACFRAFEGPSFVRGATVPIAAAERTVMEDLKIVRPPTCQPSFARCGMDSPVLCVLNNVCSG